MGINKQPIINVLFTFSEMQYIPVNVEITKIINPKNPEIKRLIIPKTASVIIERNV